LRNRIRALAAVAGLAGALAANGTGWASAPSIADLDAAARASGNRIDVATRIGESVFGELWPAEVSQISANEIGKHLIVGVRIWGVKFHRPIGRTDFADEVVAVVGKVFAAAPDAEEVDVWASVPLEVGRGVVVSGDLAIPTVRTVFSFAAYRGESPDQIAARAHAANSPDVFWDEEWVRAAFAKPGT
jgi:hypothetical protein